MKDIERLAELSEKATQGEWRNLRHYSKIASLQMLPSKRLHAFNAKLVPIGKMFSKNRDGAGKANTDFIVTLVNWFRANLQSLCQESVRSEALAVEKLMCEAIIATQDGASGRMVCDVEKLLAHFNAAKRLSAARVAEGDEYGWLIERFVNSYHEWFAGWNDDSHGLIPKSPKWTRDAFHAIRFSRKEDGERVANYDANFMDTKVIEHGFMAAVHSTELRK